MLTLSNRPILFGYEALEFEGKQVGVIRIDLQQRPAYLKKDYGKLQREKVYVRRGSSTDPSKPASPDELVAMGGASDNESQKASVVVEFADAFKEKCLGNRIAWSGELCHMPEPSQIPTVTERRQQKRDPVLAAFNFPRLDGLSSAMTIGGGQPNDRYYRQRAEYEFFTRLFRPIRLVVSNIGNTSASDVRLEMTIPANQGTVVLTPSRIPNRPQRRIDRFGLGTMKSLVARSTVRRAGQVDIDANDHRYKVEIDCGDIQSGRNVWSGAIHVGILRNGIVRPEVQAFAGNIPGPKIHELTIDATISETRLNVDEVISLPDLCK